MTIKKYCSLPVHCLATASAVKHAPSQFFDSVDIIDEPDDPGLFKAGIFDVLPFDRTLFLDVDGIALQSLDPLFGRLESEGKPYRCHVYAYYDKDSPEEMPLMYWADKSVIWEHYGFSDEQLPATQSSLQYIQKCDVTEELFGRMQENFRNPIPLEKLRNKWGGTQPDELYLNVSLAQMGYKPDLNDVIYFGNDGALNYHEIKKKYYIFSYFGGTGMIKTKFISAMDREIKKMGSKFPVSDIIPHKHANAREKSTHRKVVTGTHRDAKITLFTSYYEASPTRDAELLKCLKNNIQNPFIDKIVVVGDKRPEPHPKIDFIDHSRPTYRDFFEISNDYEGYKVLANSDIYFDNTLFKVYDVNFDNLFLCISRHDIKAHGGQVLFDASGWGRRGWSQDAWIWKGDFPTNLGDYYMGIPGCDNKIAYEAQEMGYRLHNPARDIKIYHLHESNERTYTEENRIPKPYQNVNIQTIRQITKRKLLIIQPGKVGDILICLPIAKYYSEKYHVEWMCPGEYHDLFRYVDYVKPVQSNVSKYAKVIDLSFGLNTNSEVHAWWLSNRHRFDSFVTAKYELAGVPIEERWNLQYKRNEKREHELFNKIVKNHPYRLTHDWSSYGTPVKMQGEIEFKPVGDYTIFDWRLVIEQAAEIHCIDSSLCNFVEVIDTDAELHYYKTDRVPNKYDETLLKKSWQIYQHQYSMMSSQTA